ncbi:hypothetical protein POV27_11130 [Aureisphaera galaxeae]|uniref:hypothetical protein n=1 Tax=Aureisphaera galaxeae TaxID=1538023 RepID=UPI002350D2B6|nr:hypothetical protein [Aureisphaera galaxeae]MDC8004603.1 hypothetical protein [Aureisphaera galaxeae]
MKTQLSLCFLLLFTITFYGQQRSLLFDGEDDYVDLGENYVFNPDDSFTIEAWIKIEQPGFKQIISKLGIEEGAFRGWGFQIELHGRITHQSISINSLPSGMYFLSIPNDSGVKEIAEIIKE